MDSGLGSDDEKRNRTKAQKQLQNEQKQLFSSCFIDATSLGDEGEFEHRRNDERRQGALVFRSSIPQYSMLQMPHSESDQGSGSDMQDDKGEAHSIEITTPHNSFVQLEAEVERKTPVGFYVDLGEVEVVETPPTAPVEKKNIFSMVIDFNVPKREMPSRLSTSLYGKKKQGMTRSALSSSSSHTSEEVRGSCENVSGRESRSENQNKTSEDNSVNAISLQSNCEIVENNAEFDSLPTVMNNVDNTSVDLKKNEDLLNTENVEEINENKGSDNVVNNDIPRSTKQVNSLLSLLTHGKWQCRDVLRFLLIPYFC